MPSNRRVRSLFQCGLMVAALGLGCYLLIARLCYRKAHPSDLEEVRVDGLPIDTAYLAIACEADGRASLLDNYQPPMGVLENWTRGPSNGSFSLDLGTEFDGRCSARTYLAWRSGARYAVIWRTLRGGWKRQWIISAGVQTVPEVGQGDRSTKLLELPPVPMGEEPSPEDLKSLCLQESLPDISGKVPNHGSSDRFMMLGYLKDLRSCLAGSELNDACRYANNFCLSAPHVLEKVSAPTAEQRAAALEIEEAYEEFVAAASKGAGSAKAVADRWSQLFEVLTGLKPR